MGLIDWLFRKLGIVKPKEEKKVDINKDLKAIINFLSDVSYDSRRLLRLCRELQGLRREYRVLRDEEMKKKNIVQQVNLLDQILDLYHFFEDDAVINGKRIKNIAHLIKKAVEKTGNPKLVEKTKDPDWTFDW